MALSLHPLALAGVQRLLADYSLLRDASKVASCSRSFAVCAARVADADYFIYSLGGDYFGGPQGRVVNSDAAYRYSIRTDSWETLSTLPISGSIEAAVVFMKQIHILGIRCWVPQSIHQKHHRYFAHQKHHRYFAKYDALQDLWEDLGLLPTYAASAEVINDRICLAGSSATHDPDWLVNQAHPSSISQYSIPLGWRFLPPLPQRGFKMLVCGTSLYVLAGVRSDRSFRKLAFDSNRWHSLEPLPIQVGLFGLCNWEVGVADHYVLILDTHSVHWGAGGLGTCWMFNTQVDNGWFLIPQTIVFRRLPTVAVFGSSLYVMGGMDEQQGCLDAVECLALDTWQWEVRESLSFIAGEHEAVNIQDDYIDGGICIVGGNDDDDDDPEYKKVEYFNPQLGWKTLAEVPFGRRFAKLLALPKT